jgi:GGDEF domain-containing protein
MWGCFFGMTVIILMGSAVAYRRGLKRVSLNAALIAFFSAIYVVIFLGGLDVGGPDRLARFLAHLTLLVAGFLTYQLLITLSLLRELADRQWAAYALAGLCAVILGLGWSLEPLQALAVSSAVSCLLAAFALVTSLRRALMGERLAWVAVASVFCILVSLAGFAWIALNREQALLPVQVVTAVAATLYVASLAHVIWTRYAYLIELHEIMAHGPGYDPVTRMRSHLETGQMVSHMFKDFRDKPAPMGIVVLTIANLYALEQLHGAAAVNNAFFVCAGRLRRWVPRQVEMGRLGADGFLLIMQNCTDSHRIIDMARAIELRLRRSVTLNTSREVSQLGTGSNLWVAEIGVGVLKVADPNMRGSEAIAMGRRMSRTAVSYASRIAWFDQVSAEAVELPLVLSQD